MNKLETFEQYLATARTTIPVDEFSINLILAAVLAYILSLVYAKFGSSLTNRKNFSRNFILITMTTMLIIAIVKSSLALSLGLVGALSIVRFRTAIKEPEELAYMFLSISIGLGLGASQRVITLTGVGIIIAIILIRGLKNRNKTNSNLFITVSLANPQKTDLDKINEIITKNVHFANLKRFDENTNLLDISYHIILKSFGELNSLKNELQVFNSNIELSFIDDKGITA